MNQLFFGDNINVLCEHLADESVDLIYLDPPFNSKRDYNLLFKSPKGHESEAQIEAFKDSWSWGNQAECEFDEIVHGKNTDVSEIMQALRRFLGENDMMAYLTMMANRLLELHRVLKPTGSLYLHCDPTASHYLKIVLDGVFGKLNFRNEITWKRTSGHNDARHAFGEVADNILFYTKGEETTFNVQYIPYSQEYLDAFYVHADPDGRKWRRGDLRSPSPRPNLTYDYKASNGRIYKPHPNGWAMSLEKMKELDKKGRLHFPAKEDGRIQLKRYLDEQPGQPCTNIWDDISPIHALTAERLGYPTQKPLALLERIISTSSNEGDVVLDPFCGCGTAVHAAQKLKRKWIGIDITHLAISLIEKRLKDAFGAKCKFEVHGTPKDLDAARDLATRDKYQFQWWAVSLVDAQPFQGRKKGADGGIDGLKFFHDVDKAGARKIVVSVKGGDSVGLSMVKDLITTTTHNGAEIGLFITLAEPTPKMIAEALKAGFYTGATGMKYPRIQILTIEGLLSGTQRAKHPDHQPDLNFKKAKAEKNTEQKTLGLL